MLLKNVKLFLRTVTFFQPKRNISRQFFTMTNLKIGTHSGVFHCDEVLACFMLKTLPEYKEATIVRYNWLNLIFDFEIYYFIK